MTINRRPPSVAFLADATRLNFEQKAAAARGDVRVKAGVRVHYAHDVDGDTPIEDGTIICEKKFGFAGAEGGKQGGTTLTDYNRKAGGARDYHQRCKPNNPNS